MIFLESNLKHSNMANKILQVLERNPNWHELVKPEYGYLSVAEPNYISFVSAEEPYWDQLFKYPLNNEVSDAIDTACIGEEIVAVLVEDIEPPDEMGSYFVYFEVLELPAPISVPED